MVSEQQQTLPVQYSFDTPFEADAYESTSPKNFDLTNSLEKMMLKCRAFYNMTHEALNFVALEVVEILKDLTHNLPPVSQIDDVISSLSRLDTHAKRTSYFISHLGLNLPVSVAQNASNYNSKLHCKHSLQCLSYVVA